MPVAIPLSSARRGLILSLAVAAVAPAASNTWNAAIGDGSWNDLANWTDPTSVPGPGDTAIFSTVSGTTPTTPHTVSVPTPVTVADLSIQRTGMTLDVPVGSSLTVTRPGGLSNPPTNGLYLNGGTLNAAGTVTATGVNFQSGRINGTVQFPADAVGSLLVPTDTTAVGNFLFDGRGEVARGRIFAGVSITARQVDAATPGTLTLYKAVPGAVSNLDSDTNYGGTITLDSAAGVADSKVTLTTSAGPGPIYNYGTINLNAGGSGTNTRSIVGGLINLTGTFNVASGVTADVSGSISNYGQVNIASGASLTTGAFSSPGNAVTKISGTLTTANFEYSSGTVGGTVNIAGTPPSGNRRATVTVTNPTADLNVVFHGGGDVNTYTYKLPQRISLVGQPVSGTPADLRLTSSYFDSYGTITLTGNGVANSVVSLTVAPSGSTTVGPLYNHGTLNLNAGGTGTNTRTIPGGVTNYFNANFTVAGGVTASIGKTLYNEGRLTIDSGATLTVPQFQQSNSSGVTTINGTLISPDVNYSGGTINGTIELAGTNTGGTRQLTLGGSVGTSSFAFQGGGTLNASSGVPQAVSVTARATTAVPDASLRISASTLNNYGTLTLAADAATTNAITRISSSTQSATVYNYGTLNLSAGGAGVNGRVIQGSLINLLNGKTNIAPGVVASVTQNLNNDGTLTISAGGSLKTQSFSQSNSSAVTNINGSLTAADVNYSGGAINGPVVLDGINPSNTRQLTLGGSVGTSSFVFQGGGTLNASSGVPRPVTLTARATPGKPTASLQFPASTLNNYGTIHLSADAAVTNSYVALSAPADAGTVYNYGTLNLNAGSAGTNTREVYASLINLLNATTNVAPGVTGKVAATINNDGALNIAPGATLTARTFSQSNSNAVTIIDGRLTATDVNYSGGRINGTIYLDGQNPSASRMLTLGGSVNTSSFVLLGAGTLTATSGVPQAATVEARATAAVPTGSLWYNSTTLNNYGTLRLAADAAAADSSLTLDGNSSASTLYNYGTLNLDAGGTGTNTRAVNGTLINLLNGKVNVAPGVTANVSRTLNNDGRLTVASGASLWTSTFSQSNSNAVTIVDGTLTAGDVNYSGGQIVGTINLAGLSYAFTRKLTLSDGGSTNTASFVLRGGGEVSINNTLRAGITVTGRATADQPGADLKLGSGFSTAVTNYGTLALDADADANNSNVFLTVPKSGGGYGTLFNNGTIHFNAGGTGTNSRTLSATLDNGPAGVVNVNTTTSFANPVTNRGTISLSAPATFYGLFTNASGGVLNMGVTPSFLSGFDNYGTLNVAPPPAPPAGGGPAAPVEVPYAISGNGDFTQSGSGTVILSGANTYTGETSVTNPAATLVATPAAYQNVLTNAGGLDVAAGAFVFQYDTSAPAAAAVRSALRRAAAASAPSPVETIRQLLVAGHASNFTAGQIRSSGATALRGLGYVDDGDSVTLRATLYGDADLDGGVSINDFNTLAANFGKPGVWTSGDFDYDGGVSINDFNLLAATFGQSLTGPAAAVDYSGLLAFAAAHNDLAAFAAVTGVPEPTGVAAVAVMVGMAATRRRRSPRRGEGM